MIRKLFIWGVMIIIVGSIYAIFRIWVENGETEKLKKQLISSIEHRKDCGENIRAAEILPSQYSELCFQPAYMERDDFEKLTKKSVNGYEVLQHDGAGAWWVFEKNGNGRKLTTPEAGNNGSPDMKEGLCFSRENISLNFDCNGNIFYKKRGDK